jgi:Ca-activated chloride channel homolog
LGLGNLNDAVMEKLADNGDGNYEYIDNLEQAK